MPDFFSCKDSTGRYIFNIAFFSLIGSVVIFLFVLAGYLLHKRCRRAKKLRILCRSRANTSNTNTNSSVLSASGSQSSIGHILAANNFILGRPPATDVILGIYGDEKSRNARTRFYEEKGWRGFVYWRRTGIAAPPSAIFLFYIVSGSSCQPDHFATAPFVTTKSVSPRRTFMGDIFTTEDGLAWETDRNILIKKSRLRYKGINAWRLYRYF